MEERGIGEVFAKNALEIFGARHAAGVDDGDGVAIGAIPSAEDSGEGEGVARS